MLIFLAFIISDN